MKVFPCECKYTIAIANATHRPVGTSFTDVSNQHQIVVYCNVFLFVKDKCYAVLAGILFISMSQMWFFVPHRPWFQLSPWHVLFSQATAAGWGGSWKIQTLLSVLVALHLWFRRLVISLVTTFLIFALLLLRSECTHTPFTGPGSPVTTRPHKQ